MLSHSLTPMLRPQSFLPIATPSLQSQASKPLKVWDKETGESIIIDLPEELENHRQKLPYSLAKDASQLLSSSITGNRAPDYFRAIEHALRSDDVVKTPLWYYPYDDSDSYQEVVETSSEQTFSLATQTNQETPSSFIGKILTFGAAYFAKVKETKWKENTTLQERLSSLLRDESATLVFDGFLKTLVVSGCILTGVNPEAHPVLFGALFPFFCAMGEKPIILSNYHLEQLEKYEEAVRIDSSVPKPRLKDLTRYASIRNSNIPPDVAGHDLVYTLSSTGLNAIIASTTALVAPEIALPITLVLAPIVDTFCFLGAAMVAASVSPFTLPPLLAITDTLFRYNPQTSPITSSSQPSRFEKGLTELIEGPYRRVMSKIEDASSSLVNYFLPE